MHFIDNACKEHSFEFESRYYWDNNFVYENIIRYVVELNYDLILPIEKIKNKLLTETYKDYSFPQDLINFLEKIVEEKYLQLL